MNRILIIITISLLVYSCSKDDSGPRISDNKLLISTLSNNNIIGIDSLFYENGKVTEIREYLNNQINHSSGLKYLYNDSGQLIRRFREDNMTIVPVTEINYTYNNDGSLKSSEGSISYHYSYYEDTIVRNEGNEFETRIKIDKNKRITTVELKPIGINEFSIYREFFYTGDGNIDKIVDYNIFSGMPDYELLFTYDDQINPFNSLDYKINNGLSLKMLEEATRVGHFPFEASMLDWGYVCFNKNNIVSCFLDSKAVDYSYKYGENNYPTEVEFDIVQQQDYRIFISYW
ncbi:hypothetical protein FF125_16075 [Aureibaculum algae]|uniref:DUF4595 domain-containing protein n=1 Tax=Aureibaculum algae TaxID=2584122 RepID=A0A5B7TU70_9FLAO|nr:hypothetical protein [Aureibaculum algae]QCX39880.1 hypothetical protein FF125_16075 [Aureibaculum algae]